ncbi:MAG: DinB family protein [Bacteroidota bacterium]
MQKDELTQLLYDRHAEFSAFLLELSEEQFEGQPDKWNAGQQLSHIQRSVMPLLKAFSLPKWVIRLLFGKSETGSRSYEEVVTAYQGQLSEGGKAPSAYLPSDIPFDGLERGTRWLAKATRRLNRLVLGYSEKELDTLRLPHPILGKITLREMLYFTAYHVQHHQKQIK